MSENRRFIVRPFLSVLTIAIVSLLLLVPIAIAQQYDPSLYSGLRWRMIGPFRGGRVNAVSGVVGQPDTFYFGSVGGGGRYDDLVARFTGQTPNNEREDLYNKFRRGEIRQLILSKVGNFALDLPDANVLIQVSGTFGSRQEEAQRLGRILRPKGSGEIAHFFTLVTRDTRELDFAHHRQMFLTEQGYSYSIVDGADLMAEALAS